MFRRSHNVVPTCHPPGLGFAKSRPHNLTIPSRPVVWHDPNKVNPQRKRARFAKEFKLEAVRLLERGEKPAAQLALELGVAQKRRAPVSSALGATNDVTTYLSLIIVRVRTM